MNDSNGIHRFSEFAKDVALDGEKKRLSEILNQEITVIGQNITQSKKNTGKCLKLQYKMKDGKTYITFTGSAVLIKQIEEYRDMIPFVAVIKQVGKYFSFT